MKIVQKPAVEGVPNGYVVEYFGKVDNATFFVIYRPEKDWDYNSFLLKIGPKNRMEDIEVKKVVRYRDGGTTIIDTAKGQFFFPSPLRKNEPSTLGSQPIEVYRK